MYPNEQVVRVQGRYFWELIFSYDNQDNDQARLVHTDYYRVGKTVNVKRFIRNVFRKSSSYKSSVESSISLKFGGIVDIGGSSELAASTHLELSSELERGAELDTTIDEYREVRREIEVGPKAKVELFRLCYEMEGSVIRTDIVSTKRKAELDDVTVELGFVLIERIVGINELLAVLVSTVPRNYNKKAWRRIRDTIVSNWHKSEEEAFKALVTQLGQTKPNDKKRLWSSVRATCAEILRDWEQVDRNHLFTKLLVRLANTRPSVEKKNKGYWERIRTTCDDLLFSRVVSADALVESEVGIRMDVLPSALQRRPPSALTGPL